MPKNTLWSEDEVQFLNGMLQEYGTPKGTTLNGWSEEVKEMVRARLTTRSESGVYQQIMGILKTRKITSSDTMSDEDFHSEFNLVTGA